jgi:hypothetical protein
MVARWSVVSILIILATVAFASPSDPAPTDILRAKTKVPRDEYKGQGQTQLSRVLNGHLRADEPNVKPCDQWTSEELQRFMALISDHRSPALLKIYDDTADRRQRVHNSTKDYLSHWKQLNSLARQHQGLRNPLRDTHCRQAVMWWVHHLTSEAREKVRMLFGVTVPLLPEIEKHEYNGPGALHLEQPNSCDWCHSTQAKHDNGTAGTTPPNALNWTNGPDDGNPHGWDRKRRCDQDQMPRCQLCEGIGGHAWSDKNEDIDLVDCEIVANASDVDNSTVHWPLYPKQFTITDVDGRPGYSDTLIGWKTDPFCFSFFPQNDSIPPLCYRSQDATGKWYDNEREATRSDYNVKLTGAFSVFPNITASIQQVGWQMWINNHLWVVDQCVCANPSGNHCTDPPCYSYIWHWDTFRTAQYLGREKIGVEWIQGAGVGKNAKMMELDHFIMWSHHAWTDPMSGRIVRMWKSFNGLQNYDPEAWTDSIDDPDTIFAAPPAKCKKGGAKVRIHCDDDGNYDGKTVEGQEHIDALAAVAKKIDNVEGLTHDEIHGHYTEALNILQT